MHQWVAFLRGVNVGGSHKLPMKDLRSILERCGFSAVKTYIQSGNCIFQATEKNEDAIAQQITAEIEQTAGFAPRTFVLSREALQRAIEQNPFKNKPDELKRVHFFFLAEPPGKIDLAAIEALAAPTEEFHLTEKVFYLYAPDGIGRSKLVAKLERLIPVPITARNLNTVAQVYAITSS